MNKQERKKLLKSLHTSITKELKKKATLKAPRTSANNDIKAGILDYEAGL